MKKQIKKEKITIMAQYKNINNIYYNYILNTKNNYSD